ncbi:SH3 domain-containing protein [Sphingobium sp. HBC34]|uniref:SH3 domain-containing protein n=1 Tax=Sphingobium cyanobacteriorum TaxID=3063954 RepID=A0ABT8ZMD3_9SPHN|nr:SH3 domain-containing protein [Sphingobium sp. HBC34]MDO7834910.1 SH3 domain-containing protein [Sphingobium sp. HBC34]
MGVLLFGFGMKRLLLGAGAVAALAAGADALAAPAKPVPYWASLAQDEARMRVGPSLDYPSNWVYRRRDLPVKVVQVLGQWRKVQDPDGAQGWMHVRLLSDTATAIVRVDVAPLHESARDGSRALFRAERGVVGRLSDCSGGWCSFDVKGQRGYVKASDVWGATAK